MHDENQSIERIGWLRAAILGANDGIVSTASLIAGVAAAGASEGSILVTGTAGLVAGAMRSEEHTSELQSLMRISYAVFCLKKKTTTNRHTRTKSMSTINYTPETA